jgi:hypothetical protein
MIVVGILLKFQEFKRGPDQGEEDIVELDER